MFHKSTFNLCHSFIHQHTVCWLSFSYTPGLFNFQCRTLSRMPMFGMLLSALQLLPWGLPLLAQNFTLPSGCSDSSLLSHLFPFILIGYPGTLFVVPEPPPPKTGEIYLLSFVCLMPDSCSSRSFSWIIWCPNLGQYVNVRKLNYVLLLSSTTFFPALYHILFLQYNRSMFSGHLSGQWVWC